MSFSFSGIAYTLLFFSLLFLTHRLYQYRRQRNDVVSKIFLFFSLSFLFFAFVRSVTGLFFADNAMILNGSRILVALIEAFAAAIVAYLIIHLKFPKISPWLGFSVILAIGLLAAIGDSIAIRQPSLGKLGVIEWGEVGSFSLAIMVIRLTILLLTFIPLAFILLQQFKTSEDVFIKKKSLGLGLVVIIAIIFGFVDFILTSIFENAAIYRDVTMIVLSIILFVVILITQKPAPAEKT